MFERGNRHNPLSLINRFYLDHRPVLAHDGTLSTFRKEVDPYEIIFLMLRLDTKNVYANINSFSAEDREHWKAYYKFYQSELDRYFCYSVGASWLVYACWLRPYQLKGLYKLAISTFVVLPLTNLVISFPAHQGYTTYCTTLAEKYRGNFKDNISDLADRRREFFEVDTSVYQRENHHNPHGHHDDHHDDHHSDHGHHDTSTYYGPMPYTDHENVQHIQEIDHKFNKGHSAFDHGEYILGDKVTINRRLRNVPTPEEYSKI